MYNEKFGTKHYYSVHTLYIIPMMGFWLFTNNDDDICFMPALSLLFQVYNCVLCVLDIIGQKKEVSCP